MIQKFYYNGYLASQFSSFLLKKWIKMKNLSLSFAIFLTPAGPLVSSRSFSCFKTLKKLTLLIVQHFCCETRDVGLRQVWPSLFITLVMWGYYCKHQIQNAVKWMQRNNQWPFFHVSRYRGYYIAAQRYKVSLLSVAKYFMSKRREQVKYFSTWEKQFCISKWPCDVLFST